MGCCSNSNHAAEGPNPKIKVSGTSGPIAENNKVAAPEKAEKISKTRLQAQGVILEQITDYYDFTSIIGYGTYGIVRQAKLKNGNDKLYAVKTLEKSAMGSNIETLRNELDILRKLDHPNIIKLYGVYEDKKYIHIITNLCKGGDLVDAIISRYGYSEEEAA